MKNRVISLISIAILTLASLSGCGCSNKTIETSPTQIETTSKETEPVTTQEVTTQPQTQPIENNDKMSKMGMWMKM